MKLSSLLVVSALLFSPSAVLAVDMTMNGFASISVGKTLGDDERFVAETVSGSFYDNDIAFFPESILGVQSTVSFSDKLSVTGQLVSRGGNNFAVDVERLYGSYQINQQWRFDAGRKNLHFFQYSEYLDVGYAYDFMRPPIAVYFVPYSNYDGASISYSNYLGELDLFVQVYYGNTTGTDKVSLGHINTEVNLDTKDIIGSVIKLGGDEWNIRVGAHLFDSQAAFATDLTNEQAIAIGVPPEATEGGGGDIYAPAGTQIIEDGNKAMWIVGGVSYTPGNIALNYEFYNYSDDKGFNDQFTSFLNAGYRMGKWVPTVSWSYAKEKQDDVVAGLNQGTPPTHFQTGSLTLRYDIEPQAAVKLDVTRYLDKGETPTFGDSTIVSASLDIIF